MKKQWRGVIFDMDGTLIDSANLEFEAWKQTFNHFRKDFTNTDFQLTLGKKSTEIISDHLKVEGKEAEEAFELKMALFKTLLDQKGVTSMPHVLELLLELRVHNYKIAVATGARRAKMDLIFNKLGLQGRFDVTVCAEDVEKGKPSPEIFIKAADLLKLQPADCIVFEDAQNGVVAAKKASMFCVGLTGTSNAEQLKLADSVISTFEGLTVDSLKQKFEASH